MGILEKFRLEGIGKRILPKQTAIVPQSYHPGDFSNSNDFKILKPNLKEAGAQSDVPVWESGVYWEFPDVPFRAIYEYYKRDPGIQSAVNAYKNEIIGPGFYITANDENVQKFIEDWNTRTGFESKLSILLGDTLMLGISLAEIIQNGQDMNIVPVDMRSIVATQRDEFGNVVNYKQQTLRRTFKNLDPKEFIRFTHIEVGRQAWPIGIFHSLVVPFFEFEGEPWSLADVDALMRQDYARIIHKMAAPRVWHIYENASEEQLKQQAQRDKQMKAGERGYVRSKFEIMQEQLDSTGRFKDYIDFLTNAKENGLQAPTAKLMTATGISNATYASAESAGDMFSKSLEGIKRQWEEQIEQQIYKPLLEANGFDLVKSGLEFHWGMPDKVDVDVNQIISLVTAGIMTIEEARQAVKQMNLPLSDEKIDPQKPEDGQDVDQLKKEVYRKIIKKLDRAR